MRDVIINKRIFMRSEEFMQTSDEEKLKGMLGNISDFFNEIDSRHEEHEPEFRHGRTEFDGDDPTKSEKELLAEILKKFQSGKLKSQSTAGELKSKGNKKKKNKNKNENDELHTREFMKNFWSDQGLSPEEIGRRYEIYIGWYYEIHGWKVEYNGAINGLADSGIDLICTKGNKVLIVQCKNWSRNKIIHEKYIHQLFGSATDYKMNSQKESRTGAAFYTSASFSDRAKEAAEKFHIMLHEQFHLKRFPCIKCKADTHTYYIPDDTEYFTVSIDTENGDMFCDSIDEAESLGFRHE